MIDKYINHIRGLVKFNGVDPDELEIIVKDDKIIFLYESHFSLIIQITVDIGELSKMNNYLIDFKHLD